MLPDYYQILNLTKNVFQKEIRKAYIQQASLLHPIRNNYPNAKENFIKVNEAYAVLGNPFVRRKFNAYLANPRSNKNNERQTSILESSEGGRRKAFLFLEDHDYFLKSISNVPFQWYMKLFLFALIFGMYAPKLFGVGVYLIVFGIITLISNIPSFPQPTLGIGIFLTIAGFFMIKWKLEEI